MRGSCLKTFAAKYNSSVMKMYKKYRSEKGDFGVNCQTRSGIKQCELYHEGFNRNKNVAPEFVDVMPRYSGRIKQNSLSGRLKSGKHNQSSCPEKNIFFSTNVKQIIMIIQRKHPQHHRQINLHNPPCPVPGKPFFLRRNTIFVFCGSFFSIFFCPIYIPLISNFIFPPIIHDTR